MIDSIRLVWGHAIGTAPRRARGVTEPLAAPVRLDIDALGKRLGDTDGEITTKTWGDGGPSRYGHWQVGNTDLMYREGRVELRASLPKLLLGRNDVVLDERAVHDALHKLVDVGRELTQHPLDLREADPARLDYCYQWEVPSVAFALEHVKAAFAPARKLRTENVAPAGGRSLVWGYGSKRLIRMYDKVGELKAHKEDIPVGAELDVLLRYEIQEQRRLHLRLVHEDGYRAASVRRELEHGLKALTAIAAYDVDAILAGYGEFKFAMPFVLATLYLVEHDEMWPWVKKNVSASAYYRWRARVAEMAMTVGDVRLDIPEDAFESGSTLWAIDVAA